MWNRDSPFLNLRNWPDTIKVTDVDQAQNLYFGREPVDEPEFVAVEATILGSDAAEKPSTAERSRKSKKVPKPPGGDGVKDRSSSGGRRSSGSGDRDAIQCCCDICHCELIFLIFHKSSV